MHAQSRIYDPREIEPKWQKYWETEGLFHAKTGSKKRKFYPLVEFPYPSGEGLHTGHVRGYTAMDILARKRRFEGYEVLYPIGWDAFGLPTENFAIKHGIHPAIVTKKNTGNFRRQMKSLGFSFDWSREINTTDPEYYRWTQWIFLQLFKKGLAYKKAMEINWCPSCKIGLANEEAQGGVCERCGNPTEKRDKEQWMLAITKYADRLDKDLDDVDYLEKIKLQQRNWIGRSEGAIVKFHLGGTSSKRSEDSWHEKEAHGFVEVFTTRVDTIFGCTYVVIAPEHLLLMERKGQIQNWNEVEEYLNRVKKKSEEDRLDVTKEKTGVKLEGVEATNPFTGESVPIFVADYVLGSYGTGAVMAVPAHDERDWEFAKKYGLTVRQSVAPFFSVSEGKDAIRPDKPTVRRKTAFALVKHWSEEKYLCLDWERFGWHSGIIGGIEAGEDPIGAASREIVEETGYKNPRFLRFIGGEMHTNFFAAHKNVNRYAEGVGMLFQLENEVWSEPDEDDTQHHRATWIDGSSMPSFLNLQNFQYMWRVLETDRDCFTDDGVLVSSGEFSGLKSAVAREKMTEWMERKGLGRKQTNYKLRDWVFSRQRYWGEPIPLVRCEACGVKEWKPKYELNFSSQETWKKIVAGKKTVETRALNPDEPNRYFGDVNVGEILKLTNRKTGESAAYRVKRVYRFDSLESAMKDEDFDRKVWADGKPKHTAEEWKKGYASCSPDYLDRIEKCGLIGWEIEPAEVGKWIPIPEKDLPIELPKVKSYQPTETGESPLAAIKKWVNTKCPKCGGPARRETDTMPNWAGSSWYFLRYADPKCGKSIASKDALRYWTPVDWYNGGMEHTTLHLLYSRFWHKFLYDIGIVPTSEPYQKRTSHGLILAEGGVKMSKSKGNVVNPDDIVRRFGADTLRVYEMFMGPFDQNVTWSTESISGARRFLEKAWRLSPKVSAQQPKDEDVALLTLLQKTIKKVSEDIEAMRFNTAVSALMILVNDMEKRDRISLDSYSAFLILLCPFAPHIAEELWQAIGHKQTMTEAAWPSADPKYLNNEEVEIAVQVNGKLRARIRVAAGLSQDDIELIAKADSLVAKHLKEGSLRKVIFVPERLVNFVVS